MRSLTATFALLFATTLLGCRSAPPGDEVPRYEGLTYQEIIVMLANQADAIQTFSASGVLRLDDPERGSVTLDVALLAEGEDRLRLRAWKLGRAVFDLTRDGDALWLWTSDTRDQTHDPAPPINAEQVGIGWSLLSGRRFTQPPQGIEPGNPLTLTYLLDEPSGTVARMQIDRETATVQRCEVLTRDQTVQQTILPDRYRLIDGQAIATRIVSSGPAADAPAFTLELTEIEINIELPATAFTPPRAAQRQP